MKLNEPTRSASVALDGAAARKRTRALALGITSGLVSRILTLAAPLLTIPVTLHYLGAELFGFWMVITSVTAMATFADLGLGNGLLTKLAPAVATGDHSRAKSLISAAYLSLGSVAVLLVTVTWIAVPLIDWSRLVDADSTTTAQDIQTVAIFGLTAFSLMIPLSLVQRVQYAFQEAWKSNLWQVVGAGVTVGAVFTSALAELGPAAVIGAAVFSNPLVSLVNTICYFGFRPHLMPAFRSASRELVRVLLRLGFSFFVLSVVVSLSLNADNLIVASAADFEAVSQFSITTKLFSLLSLAVTLVALPLWPANGEALARGDVRWVRKVTRLMVALSAGAVSVFGVMLLLARDIVTLMWLGNGQSIPFELAIVLVGWSVAVAAASPLFTVQNSVGLIRYQLIGWILFAVSSLPLKCLLFRDMGLPGVPLAGVICYILFVLPSAYIGYRVAIRRAGRTF